MPTAKSKNKSKKKEKEKLRSKLTTKALNGALTYRGVVAKGYVDIQGKSIPSIRMRNRIHDYAVKNFAKSDKAELVILMYMKTTQSNILKKPKLGVREINRTLSKLIRTTRVGEQSPQTLKQFIVDNQTVAEFGSSALEISEFEQAAGKFFDRKTQEAIGSAFASVI